MKRRLSWTLIALNLKEAREELESLEELATDAKARNELRLEVGLAHAYHHLNFAWHVRRIPTRQFTSLTDHEFNRWGRFPKDIALAKVPVKKRPRKIGKRGA